MKVFSWDLELPKKACCQEDLAAASATAYLLDWGDENTKKARPAIVICPGGGYRMRSQREGEPVAMEYLSMGCQVFVLQYTVAPGRFPRALLELALLVSQIREHSLEWDVDPEKILVSGFSAGGHLACSLGVFWNRNWVYEVLGKKEEDIRPDGMILGYPVITSGPYCHEGSFENLLGEDARDEGKRQIVSLEKQVGPHTPKTFLWHTVTDESVPVQNALLLAEALVKSRVSVELHLYPAGCHGLSLATEETCKGQKRMIVPQCQSWIHLVETWIKAF